MTLFNNLAAKYKNIQNQLTESIKDDLYACENPLQLEETQKALKRILMNPSNFIDTFLHLKKAELIQTIEH